MPINIYSVVNNEGIIILCPALKLFCSLPQWKTAKSYFYEFKIQIELSGQHLSLLKNATKFGALDYRKVSSSRLTWLVAHPRILRLFMKGKFDAYAL